MQRISEEYFQRLLSDPDPIKAVSYVTGFWRPRLLHWSAPDPFANLSPVERNVQLVLNYTAEVGDYGHLRFLIGERGRFALETLEALGEMQFGDLYRILGSAFAEVSRLELPDNPFERERMIESLYADPSNFIRTADTEFIQLSMSEYPRCLAYMRDNQDQVLIEERS